MNKEEAIEHIKTSCYLVGYPSHDKEYETRKCINKALDMAIKALEQQPCDDFVSRQAMLDAITEIDDNTNMDIYTNEVREIIKELSPVTPTHRTCKDCMHWKDSDGVYRRGINAESKCPINIKEVYEGEFYCKYFEGDSLKSYSIDFVNNIKEDNEND